MKVIMVAEAADVVRGIATYAAVADPPDVRARRGASCPRPIAKAFDWTILSGPQPCRCRGSWPGGLTPDNLAEAVRRLPAHELSMFPPASNPAAAVKVGRADPRLPGPRCGCWTS